MRSIAAVTANVTKQSDWENMVSTAKSKFGGVDILVNNAGTSYRNKPTNEVTEDEFDRVMAVNVKSIFLSINSIIPVMIERGGGAIINIASIGAMRPRPGLVWYNASKGAVANVSDVLHVSLWLRAGSCGNADMSQHHRPRKDWQPSTANIRSE